MLVEDARGYIDCVFTTEVEKKDILSMRSGIHAYTNLPCVMEIDAIASDQLRDIATCMDGLVLRTPIVQLIETYGKECIPYVYAYVKEIKDGLTSLKK